MAGRQHPIRARTRGVRDANSRLALEAVADSLDDIRDQLGLDNADAAGNPQASSAPPAANFTVAGYDGKFVINIINPQSASAISVSVMLTQGAAARNQQGRKIIHQLRSAVTLLFDAASNTSTYEPSEKTHWEVQDPDQQKYWQLRSSYDGSTWNDWADYLNPDVCGVQQIDSRQMRSLAMVIGSLLNVSNDATVDYTDVDATHETVNVHGPGGGGSDWHLIRDKVIIGTISATAFTGKAYATTYYIGYDVKLNTWTISTVGSDTTGDNMVKFVAVTNTAMGAGGGTTGGGGAAAGGEGGGGRGVLT